MIERVPGILSEKELADVEKRFGVGEAQVRRDHVISHVLAAIAEVGPDDILFFGGTALSRTHLSGLRLSEDVDLIALGNRSEIADRVERAIIRGVGRSLGSPSFVPHLREVRHSNPSVMSVAGLNVQLQLLASTGYPHWPSEVVEIEQRYSDVRPAQLRVLTSPAFAAAKLLAWWDRGTSRDLYDLWAMAVRGMVDHEAAELFSRHGPLRHATDVPFSQLPTGAEWEAALGHQCILQVTVQEAADVVREAWKSV